MSSVGLLEGCRADGAADAQAGRGQDHGGFDVVEFTRLYDNRGEQTALLVRRIMLQFMTGMAMRKDGIDPEYIHPRVEGAP